MGRKEIAAMIVMFFGIAAFAFAGGQSETASGDDEPVTLVYLAYQPEYRAAERQIWDIYEEENPNVDIEILEVSEDGTADFIAKVTAGEAPHFAGRPVPQVSNDTYHLYANLSSVDIPYLDDIAADQVALTRDLLNQDGILALNPFQGRRFTWIWHKDILREAGLLEQAETMTTWDEVDAFLADLKEYVDSDPDLDYVFDFGWHNWVLAGNWLPMFSLSLGGNLEDTARLYRGEISWTDLENNPYVPAFEKMKEYYDLGYLPDRFYLRAWETEFEASFIAKKSAFTWHGPWLWNKAAAADPDVELGGAPIPANPRTGELLNNLQGVRGGVIYAQWEDSELMPEIERAFVWWHSPEVVQMRADAYNFLPNFTSLMPIQSDSVQYNEAIAEVFEGRHGPNAHWIDYAYGNNAVLQYMNKGSEFPIQNDSQAAIIGRYLEGEITMLELMENFQARWEQAFTIP